MRARHLLQGAEPVKCSPQVESLAGIPTGGWIAISLIAGMAAGSLLTIIFAWWRERRRQTLKLKYEAYTADAPQQHGPPGNTVARALPLRDAAPTGRPPRMPLPLQQPQQGQFFSPLSSRNFSTKDVEFGGILPTKAQMGGSINGASDVDLDSSGDQQNLIGTQPMAVTSLPSPAVQHVNPYANVALTPSLAAVVNPAYQQQPAAAAPPYRQIASPPHLPGPGVGVPQAAIIQPRIPTIVSPPPVPQPQQAPPAPTPPPQQQQQQQTPPASRPPSAGIDSEYEMDDLDDDWKELLADLDNRLADRDQPSMNAKERAVAIKRLLVATGSRGADFAMRSTLDEVIRFRKHHRL